MKKLSPAILSFTLLCAGCATIISGTKQEMYFNSTPTGANVQIKTYGGMTVFKGETPVNCRLRRGKEYVVTFKMDGYEAQELRLDHEFNAWVIGNLIYGNVFGFAIDFVDGAMWNLDPDMIHVELVRLLADGKVGTYAVIGAVDETGRLRTKAIPMIPEQ